MGYGGKPERPSEGRVEMSLSRKISLPKVRGMRVLAGPYYPNSHERWMMNRVMNDMISGGIECQIVDGDDGFQYVYRAKRGYLFDARKKKEGGGIEGESLK